MNTDQDLDHLAALEAAFGLAHNLVRELGYARKLARDLRHARTSAPVRDRNRAINGYSPLDRHVARTRSLAFDLTLNSDGCARELDRVLARVRDLDRDLDREVTGDLADQFGFPPDLVHDLGLNRDHFSDLGHAYTRARDLDRILARARRGVPRGSTAKQSSVVHVDASAGRLAAIAALLLPAAERARFSEEYCSELWDLAAGAAGRCRQIIYAARQLRCAVPLRFAVLAPRGKKASS